MPTSPSPSGPPPGVTDPARLPLTELVPHAPPMLLIDELVVATDDEVHTRLRVHGDSPFVSDGIVLAPIALEYMAQSVAAWLGVWSKRRGEAILGGVLLGTPRLRLACTHFRVGQALDVHCRHLWGASDLQKFSGRVEGDGAVLAEGELSVMRLTGSEPARGGP